MVFLGREGLGEGVAALGKGWAYAVPGTGLTPFSLPTLCPGLRSWSLSKPSFSKMGGWRWGRNSVSPLY